MVNLNSTFARNTEDWTISGDVNVFEWRNEGGNPGGYLHWEDAATGDVAYWASPVKFLGDQRAFKGGRLVFDWFVTSGSYFDAPDVILSGGGLTLFRDVAPPTGDWSRVSIKLSNHGEWHIGSSDGPLATSRDIATVLADVSNLLIRAEHINGGESGGLDNIFYRSRPEPSLSAIADDAFVRHPSVPVDTLADALPGHALLHFDIATVPLA